MTDVDWKKKEEMRHKTDQVYFLDVWTSHNGLFKIFQTLQVKRSRSDETIVVWMSQQSQMSR